MGRGLRKDTTMAGKKTGKGKTIAIVIGVLFVLGIIGMVVDSCHRVIDPEYAAQKDAEKAQKEAEKAAKSAPVTLAFSDMTVEITPDESASKFTVTVKGTVTNETPREISNSYLPDLKHGSSQAKLETGEKELEAGKAYSVAYTATLDWSDESQWKFEDYPKSEVSGLDGVAEQIPTKYATLRADTEAQRAEAAERAAAEAEQKRAEREQAHLNSTCYVTPTGQKYHSNDHCSGLNGSKNLTPMTVEQARNSGYEACDICAY